MSLIKSNENCVDNYLQMNIIFEEKLTEDIREKYILLELDTFSPEPNVFKKCWALIGKDEVNVQEVHNMDQFTDLHHNMIKNYGLKNWKFCHDALDHLIGKFRGEIDSFYRIMRERVEQLEKINLPDTWSPVVITYGNKEKPNEMANDTSNNNNQ